MKLRLIDRYGPPLWCDPDFYPVARSPRPDHTAEVLALRQTDPSELESIIQHDHLDPARPDPIVVHERAGELRALDLRPDRDAYRFEVVTQNRAATGSIDRRGGVTGEGLTTGAHRVACPICLAATARIATPDGEVPVVYLRPGDRVWTVDATGHRVPAPVVTVASIPASPGHMLVRLRLSDGREVAASPGHPTADGRRLGDLHPGDTLDGDQVTAAWLEPYQGERTWDLLPAGATGAYWADGVLLGSTLRAAPAEPVRPASVSPPDE